MQLDMEALERALAPIKRVGMEEISFDVEGQLLYLRPLLPHEEVAMQRYAQEALVGHQDDEGTDRWAVMEFTNRFRIETIAYSLVQIDDTDLREVEYIATGGETASGKPIRVPKHVALRSLIEKQWSRPMVQAAFAKYGELLTKIELKAAALVQFDPADIEAEISRLQGQLKGLKEEKSRRAEGDPNVMLEQMRAINAMDEYMGEQNREAAEGPPIEKDRPDPIPAEEDVEDQTSPQDEEWATFDGMPSPKDLEEASESTEDIPEEDEAPASTVTPREPVRPPQMPLPTREEPRTDFDKVMDSFADADDEGAIAAEEARILAARRRMAQGQAPEQSHTTGRTPPHMRGAIPEGLSGGDFRAATPEELAAKGIPPHLAAGTDPPPTPRGQQVGMAQPTETLSNRGRKRGTEGPVVNQVSDGREALNRNFQPKKG